MENREQLEGEVDEMTRPIEEWADRRGPAYLRQLEKWGQSKSVLAKQAFEKNVIWPSKKMQALVGDGMKVYEDVQEMRWGKEMRADGWYEWVNNKDLKELFEDAYQVKESFKVLAESRMARKNNRLGMATLEDPHFQKMWGMLKDDLDVKSLEQLGHKA